ncbi:Protein accellerated cell death 6 [Vitis vinifera]|uniref:Protein accellerated cell death 6 n=1 Tax=Vitis vinifera TaxID=29760 RepID=A0A438BNF2_VITVI|nr:Protein accellerated cell death 6 [Vitis vinifera]
MAQSRMDQRSTSNDGRAQTTYMDADLYTAASKGNISKLEQLEACDLGRQRTPKSNTILHIAAQFGQLDCVKRILELTSFSSLLKINLKGDTPLHLAAREGHLTVVEALIQAAKPPNEIESGVGVDKTILRMANKEGDTALHEAVRYHHPEVVKLLIKEDPQFTYGPNISGGTPIHMAVERGHVDLVQIIIENTRTSPAYSGILGRTALHAAVIRNDQEITTKLLEWKPSLTEEVDQNGWSPLHCAAYFGYTTIVRQLLNKSVKSVAYLGIKPGMQTALHLAAIRGHKDIVDLLLSYYPDCCEQVDDNGKNVLHFAMMRKQDDYPRMFLQNDGLRVRGLLNERDAQGDTPLHLLASYLIDDENFVLDDKVDKMGLNNENLTPRTWFQEPPTMGCKREVPRDKEVTRDREDKGSSGSNSISTLKKVGETHLIVTALVATVTFAAGFTLPGGYNENDGLATLGKKEAFKAFVVADTLAMVSSVSAAFVYFFMAGYEKEELLHKHLPWGFFLTMFGMGAMVVAFMTGMYAVLPRFSWLPIPVCVLCCCFFLVFYHVFKQFQKARGLGGMPSTHITTVKLIEAEDGSRAEIGCMDDTLYKAAAEGHANEDKHFSSLRRAGETYLIVAALIATVTFAAGAVWFYFLMATAFHLGGKVQVVAFMIGLYAVLPPSFGLPILASCCAICCCSYFLAGYVVI